MDMYLDVEFDFALYLHSINQLSKGRVYSFDPVSYFLVYIGVIEEGASETAEVYD